MQVLAHPLVCIQQLHCRLWQVAKDIFKILQSKLSMDIEQGTRNSLFAMTITEKKIGSEQDGADAVTPSTSPDGAAREKVARKMSHAAEEALHAVQKNLSGDFEDAVPRVEQNALLAEPEEHERALLAEYADAEKLHKKACETIDELARRVRCCMRALFLAQTKVHEFPT
uniref:Uncharacterized protein n=2 Tax=Chrysotila carterae TaxID=13221 RepID=A0A7S4F7W9_CHRCT